MKVPVDMKTLFAKKGGGQRLITGIEEEQINDFDWEGLPLKHTHKWTDQFPKYCFPLLHVYV